MNKPAEFPMQPLTHDAPDALRLAWYRAERAWKIEQLKLAELGAVQAGHVPHSVELDAVRALAGAEDRMRDAMSQLFTEYHSALSMTDGATQRTA